MKHLLPQLYRYVALCMGSLLVSSTCLSGGDKPVASPKPPKIEDCFQINWMLRADDAHYWADWVNTCPYTIDSVYVMVGFTDHTKKPMGNGVWPMYFVLSGAHQVTRFSAPAQVEGFEAVLVHRITTDSAVAFSEDRNNVPMVSHAAPPAGTVIPAKAPSGVHDTGIGKVIPAH
jgi:hypothetical protein